jgi:hypothetical protein
MNVSTRIMNHGSCAPTLQLCDLQMGHSADAIALMKSMRIGKLDKQTYNPAPPKRGAQGPGAKLDYSITDWAAILAAIVALFVFVAPFARNLLGS